MSPEVSTTFFWAGTVIMALGTLGFGYIRLADPENSAFHNVITAVGAVATLAYLSLALDVGFVTVGTESIYLGRYLQWILGTPLIVLYLGMLADTDGTRLGALITVDVLAMVAATGTAVTTGTARWVMWVVGMVLYTVLIYGLLRTLGAAAEDQSTAVTALFTKLRNLTVVVWTFYPIAWLAGPLGLGVIDPFAEVLLVTYLDLAAKIGFGFIAANSKIALDRMSGTGPMGAWRDVLA
jgi:sensory rhodopsin